MNLSIKSTMQMFNLINIYPLLPYPFKVVAATGKGFILNSIRYDKYTDRMVEEALSRESWTPLQWKNWQEENLSRVLHQAAHEVPYYRRHWELKRRNGDRSSIELLENWPILTKDLLHDNPQLFISDKANKNSQIVEHTSGTTGTPLTIYLSKNAVRKWYALAEARWRNWYGFSRHDRWGIIGGQMVTHFSRTRPPFWVWNSSLNQLYLSSYHLSQKNIPDYIEAIRQHRLVYLLGYASSLATLAQFAIELNIPMPKLKAVISNAEPLYSHQRETIAQAFKCPVYNTYGLSENVCAASECAPGQMHLWPEVGVIEIIEDECDAPVKPGDVGRVICTGFLNETMPLIRYQVGDRASLADGSNSCPCGRHMPILGDIEGRMDDIVLTPDGRRVGRLDPVFKSNMPIREAQIIQESLTALVVKFVPADGFTMRDRLEIVERLLDRVGPMEIVLEEVKHIPRSTNGKFQAVRSNL